MVLIGISLWIKSFLHPHPMSFFYDSHPMPLYALTLSLVSKGKASILLALALLIITGFMLIRLNTRFIFIQDRTHLPLFFYLCITGGMVFLHQLNPVVPASIFILLALERMLASYRIDRLSMNPFEASFLLGIASLFYAPAGLFLVLLWFAQALLRPSYWKEWLYTILGFALPYIFLYGYYYLSGRDFHVQTRELLTFLEQNPHTPALSVTYRIYIGYILLMVLISSIFMLRVFQAKKILARRTFNLLFWWFILSIAIYFLVPSASYEMIIIAVIPVSFILAHYFNYTKIRPWIAEFMFVVFAFLTLYTIWSI